MFKRQNIFRLALIIAILVVSYLVFSKPNYPQNIPNLDKVGHFGSFFGLSFLVYFAFKPKWYLVAAAMAGYAVFIELVQSRLPYRSASVGDVIADMAGVAAFYFCLWLVNRYRHLQSQND